MLILLGVAVVVLAFGGVLVVGAPYLPTLKPQAKAAIELLNLQPGQTLLELGCGDGTVLLAAARSGLHVIGIELNPFLVVVSWLRTRRYKKQVRLIWGNFWQIKWPEADSVFVFLLDRFMPRLDLRMQKYNTPLVSLAFKVPGKAIVAEKQGVYLYDYQKS